MRPANPLKEDAMLHSLCKAGIAAALAASALAAGAATVVATYNFDSTLAALESGAPSLVCLLYTSPSPRD